MWKRCYILITNLKKYVIIFLLNKNEKQKENKKQEKNKKDNKIKKDLKG